MKVQRLFTNTFWLALVCTTLMVWTIFRLSPTLAHSTTMPPAQLSAAPMTIAQGSGAKSLYDRLGGYNVIAAVVDDALPRVVNDPKLTRFFIGLSTNSKQRLRQLLVEQICLATGGPCVYTGRSMTTVHTGLSIKESEFQAFAGDVVASLDKFNVPKKEKDELVGIVASLQKEIVGK